MRWKTGYSCSVTHCRSDKQICSHCGKTIGKGRYAYSLRKKGKFSSYNIWIHFNCIDDMCKGLKECYEEHKEEIVLEGI